MGAINKPKNEPINQTLYCLGALNKIVRSNAFLGRYLPGHSPFPRW